MRFFSYLYTSSHTYKRSSARSFPGTLLLIGSAILGLTACDSSPGAAGSPGSIGNVGAGGNSAQTGAPNPSGSSTGTGGGAGSGTSLAGGSAAGGVTATGTGATSSAPVVTTSSPQRSYATDVMIYNGAGAWTDEVSSLESIMSSNGLTFTEVTDSQVNAMTGTDYAKYGMMLWPGGSGTEMLAALPDATRTLIMDAVRTTGLGYLGFCAGAFLGVSPAPATGQAPAFFSIISDPEENYYYLENQGVDEAMTLESFPNGSTQEILWYGGPVTPNITGGVVAKYPTGDPAITETPAGNGYAIVSGVHPAAPLADIQGVSGTATAFNVALELINAALKAAPLPTF